MAACALALTLCACDTASVIEAAKEGEPINPWLLGPILAVATLSSEDLTCATAGVLAERGVISFAVGAFWCWLGIFIGDNGLYWIGRWLGPRSARLWLFRSVLTPKRIKRGAKMFEIHGGWVLFTSRFLPGTRVAFFVSAGIVRYPFRKFALLLAIAAGLWAPAVAAFAMWLGDRVEHFLVLYEKIAVVSLVIAVVGAWIAIQLIIPLLSHRGRMMWVCRLRRLCEWQFWPTGLIFSPVFFYNIWQGVKHRRLMAFTACNPGLPLDSKSAMLGSLGVSDRVARWRVLDPAEPMEQRLGAVEKFVSENGLAFPLVLKPDVGQHGRKVAIVNSIDEVRARLEDSATDMLVQEFATGEELSVFYAKRPGSEKSEILSTTGRALPTVIGDGKRTLERLILANPHALRMAPYFLNEHEDEIDEIPAEGEVVTLSEVGARLRGGILTNASARGVEIETIRLALDQVVAGVEGFHFGQFDLRISPGGNGIKIIDFSGAGSETTHIYEMGFPLWRAWRDLALHWRVAYQIGLANIEAGAEPLTFWAWLRSRRRARLGHTVHPIGPREAS